MRILIALALLAAGSAVVSARPMRLDNAPLATAPNAQLASILRTMTSNVTSNLQEIQRAPR